MVRKKNPEDGEELSKVTRVILNDLKGHREINHDFRKKNHFQKRKEPDEKEDITDHSQWMPKHIPKEMTRAIKAMEKAKPVPKPPRKRVSVCKRKDSFEYVVKLNNGRGMKANRVVLKGEKVILINEDIETAIPATAIEWIRETRVRTMTLQIQSH